MSGGYDDAFDNRRFSAHVLKKALTEAFSSLGPTWREVIFEDMAGHGLTFDSDRTYSINEIRPFVYAIFEKDMGEVLIEKLRNNLNSVEL